jgi:ABC-type amino acid transport substrate-binding protein
MITIKNMLRFGIFFIFMIGIWYILVYKIGEIHDFAIAVIAGTPIEIKAHQFKNVSEIKIYDDNRQTFQELMNRKVDGVLTDRLAGLNQIQKSGYHNVRLAGDLLDRESTAIAFLPEDQALRQEINRALIWIIHNGIFARISRKYFGQNILQSVRPGGMVTNVSTATDDSWQKIRRRGQITLAISEEGDHQFDLEIAEAICNHLGVKFVSVRRPWDAMSEGLWTKRYDGIWGISSRIDELLNHDIAFSQPIYDSGTQLFVRNDSRIKDPAVLWQETPFDAFSLSKFIPHWPILFAH